MSTYSDTIYDVLNNLNVPKHVYGYKFMQYMLDDMCNNYKNHTVHKIGYYYNNVASKFNVTPRTVERTSRYFISKIDPNSEYYRKVFNITTKLSISKFTSYLVDYIMNIY